MCCEGGPTLFADLIAAGLVDQLCLTVAPLLAGAGAVRVADGRPLATHRWTSHSSPCWLTRVF